MADDRLILVLGHELLGAREGDLVDVAVDLVGRHADSAVGDREQPLVGVHRNADRQVAQFTLHFAARSQCFEFLRGVDCVRHQFAQEDFVVGIEEFLDDGKDVFGRHPDFTVCHSFSLFFPFAERSNYVPAHVSCQNDSRRLTKTRLSSCSTSCLIVTL